MGNDNRGELKGNSKGDARRREKGLYVELGAYQHHVFMDWRFVDDEHWELVNDNLNGAGVESMQAKFDEMFGEKKAATAEEMKIKKTRKKAVKKVESGKKKATVKKSANLSTSLKAERKTEKKTVKTKTVVKKKVKIEKKPVTKRSPAKKKPVEKKVKVPKPATKKKKP